MDGGSDSGGDWDNGGACGNGGGSSGAQCHPPWPTELCLRALDDLGWIEVSVASSWKRIDGIVLKIGAINGVRHLVNKQGSWSWTEPRIVAGNNAGWHNVAVARAWKDDNLGRFIYHENLIVDGVHIYPDGPASCVLLPAMVRRADTLPFAVLI